MCCDHDQLLYDTQDKFIDKNKTPGMQYRLAAIITKWFAAWDICDLLQRCMAAVQCLKGACTSVYS